MWVGKNYPVLLDHPLMTVKFHIQAFATSTTMFYIGTTVDIFISTKAIAIRSIISKKIPAQDLGKAFSVLGILENLNGFVFPSLYSFIYLKTVDTFLGAIYLVSEGFFVLTLILFITIYIMTRHDEPKAVGNGAEGKIAQNSESTRFWKSDTRETSTSWEVGIG